ncbi:DegT/DnrJ/EryC1/StrS family aminotransferase [Verrucomicrobiales bacterium]|nr:DegT/DnrJ/EryC1/StrS family aminotransferase [Verrucomicrobiales bacterium]
MIPFSLPFIDKDVVNEVNDCLLNTGWLTSGPKVIEFECEIKKYTQAKSVVCVNSWTSGAMLMLRWFGVGPGDEVIIPSYTYAATAMCILNIGAQPIMVDVRDDFTIDPEKLDGAITDKTKVIIPVDIGGLPCDYKSINEIVKLEPVRKLFRPNSLKQEKLKRILVLSDAAHSIGGTYRGEMVGKLTDSTVFSFHSVKNITTGEGGAVCLNLPQSFDCQEEYKHLKSLSLNGQNKSAFEKSKPGSWRYDIIDQGLKVNMPDICAAIGLSQIRVYKSSLLPERKNIFKYYNNFFNDFNWAITPTSKNQTCESSYHLYMLRLDGVTEIQRDQIIDKISSMGVGVNVHYLPLPMLTLFKKLGFDLREHPISSELFKNEITLPVYNGLSEKNLHKVCQSVVDAYDVIISNKI